MQYPLYLTQNTKVMSNNASLEREMFSKFMICNYDSKTQKKTTFFYLQYLSIPFKGGHIRQPNIICFCIYLTVSFWMIFRLFVNLTFFENPSKLPVEIQPLKKFSNQLIKSSGL